MNKQLIVLLLALGFPMATYALKPQSVEIGVRVNDIKAEHERMESEHGTNAEEKAKVEAIINDENMKFKALMHGQKNRLHNVIKSEQMAKLDAPQH